MNQQKGISNIGNDSFCSLQNEAYGIGAEKMYRWGGAQLLCQKK